MSNLELEEKLNLSCENNKVLIEAEEKNNYLI